MANADIVGEFDALRNPVEAPQAETSETAPQTPTPATQAKIEELEIMLQGKPFRLPVNAEIPVKHNGQILKTPLEKLLNSFRQSSHIEDKLKEYKTMREKFESERGDLDSFNASKQKYGAIQDWSEKNPEQWERLWESFQSRDKLLTGNPGETSENAMAPLSLMGSSRHWIRRGSNRR
jgi:hypothetical protein